jgi:hypothetical protein
MISIFDNLGFQTQIIHYKNYSILPLFEYFRFVDFLALIEYVFCLKNNRLRKKKGY